MKKSPFAAALLIGGSALLFAFSAQADGPAKTGQEFGNYSGMIAQPGAKGSPDGRYLKGTAEGAATTYGSPIPAAPEVEPEWVPLDLNENGTIDAIAMDSNGDGMYDVVLLDEDEDGVVEAGIYDLDYNGVIDLQLSVVAGSDGTSMDVYALDENEDGTVEVYGYDYDQDGQIDEWKEA